MQGNVSTPSGNAPSDTTPSDTARANHDALFGEGVSTLARTDPELIAYFDTLAFDEVLADAAALDPGIDLHTRMLVQLAATLAAGGLAEFRVLAAAGLAHAGLSTVELKELVYQSVAYEGPSPTAGTARSS